MADDTLILRLELDSTQAQRQAQRFIADLEKRVRTLSRELGKALGEGVGDEASDDVRKLTRELDKLQRELRDVQRDTQQADRGFARLGVRLRTIAAGAAALGFAAVARGFSNAAGEAFQLTARFEQTERSLQALVARERVATGEFEDFNSALAESAPLAEELLTFIQELARQSPFSREQVQAAFQTALAYGFTIDEAQRLVTATTDLTAATGAGADAANRIALALGQISAKGRVSAEELNQLREAGLNVNPILEGLGFTLDDVTRGLVDADTFIQATVETIERDFGGAAAQATNTLQGLISTLGDVRADALRAFFAEAIAVFQPTLQAFVENFSDLIPVIEEAGMEVGEFIRIILEGGPSAAAVVETIGEAFRLAGQAAQGAQAVTGGTAQQLSEQLAEQLEALDAVERIQRLAAAGEASGIAGDIFGLTGAVNEQAIENLNEIVAGSENLAEVQTRLNDAFGDSIEQFEEFNTIVIQTENGTLTLNGTYEDLLNTSLATADAQRDLAFEVFNASNALEVEDLSASNAAIAQERLSASTAASADETANLRLETEALNAALSGSVSAASRRISGLIRRTGGGRGRGGGRAATADTGNLVDEALAGFEQDFAAGVIGALNEALGESDFADIIRAGVEAGVPLETLTRAITDGTEISAEQLAEAAAQANLELGRTAIQNAFFQGLLQPEQLDDALASLNEQIEAGVTDLDLSAFGIEDVRIASQTEEFTKLNAAADKLGEAADRVATAFGNVADSQAALAAEQLLAVAAQETDLEQRQRFIDLAFEQLVAGGLLTQAEADRERTLLALTDTLDTLNALEAEQGQILQDTESARQDALQTATLLNEQLGLTGEQSATLAGILTEEQIPAFLELLETGTPLLQIFQDLGISLEELPEDVQVNIETNADDALFEVNELQEALAGLAAGETVVNIRGNITGLTTGTGAGAVPVPDDIGFQGGGFTGNIPVNQIAGVVHGQETVIPASVRRGGIAAAIGFLAANDPIFRAEFSQGTAGGASSVAGAFSASAAVPSVTSITNTTNTTNTTNNTRGGDNITQIVTGGGDSATRSLVRFRENQTQNRLMRREGRSVS